MFNLLHEFKISNWDEFPNIKGISFDLYNFKDVPEINNVRYGYKAKGHACSCGTTFVSAYSICPHCGNRDFEYEERWTSNIQNDTCFITKYAYYVKCFDGEFIIQQKFSQPSTFEKTQVNYKNVYEKHPELLDIPKYKYLYETALFINNDSDLSVWWMTSKLYEAMLSEFGKYDLEFSKYIVSLFEYPSKLSSFLGDSHALSMLAFIKMMNYDIRLVRKTNVYDIVYHHEVVDNLPREIIEAVLAGGYDDNVFAALVVAGEMLNKYKDNNKCISMLTYYLEHAHKSSRPKVELPIFMEWALTTDEDVTMKKFYWYMNAKYIQRSNMNDNFEKLLTNFDNDPITALIKITKA